MSACTCMCVCVYLQVLLCMKISTELFACFFQVVRSSLVTYVCVVVQMFKGKENHLELIQELRTVHALQREEQELQKADKELLITLKKQRDQNSHKVKHRHIHIQNFTNITHFRVSLGLLAPLPDLSRGSVSGKSGRCRA